MRFRLIALLAVLVAAPAQAAPRVPRDYPDARLIDGFVRTVFGVEAPRRAPADETERVKKWQPAALRFAVVNLARRDRTAEVEEFVGVLGRTVAGLGVGLVDPDRGDPNAVVFLVDRADYREVIRRTLPAGRATRFLERQYCSAVAGGPDPLRFSHALIFLVADRGDRNFRHCMVEEITQSLGPVNDDRSLTDSIYNDYNDVDTFTVFDWYILNMLYDPRVEPGMTRVEVERVLPAVIADCRKRLGALRAAGLIGD